MKLEIEDLQRRVAVLESYALRCGEHMQKMAELIERQSQVLALLTESLHTFTKNLTLADMKSASFNEIEDRRVEAKAKVTN